MAIATMTITTDQGAPIVVTLDLAGLRSGNLNGARS